MGGNRCVCGQTSSRHTMNVVLSMTPALSSLCDSARDTPLTLFA